MVEYIITISLVILSIVYIIFYLKKKGSECNPTQCDGCPYSQGCEKDEKT